MVKRVAFPLALRLFLAPTFCHLALENSQPQTHTLPSTSLFLSFSSLSPPRRLQTCPSLQPTCKKCVSISISSSRTGAWARAVVRQRTRARISSSQLLGGTGRGPSSPPPPQLTLAVEHHVVLCADSPSCVLLSIFSLSWTCFFLAAARARGRTGPLPLAFYLDACRRRPHPVQRQLVALSSAHGRGAQHVLRVCLPVARTFCRPPSCTDLGRFLLLQGPHGTRPSSTVDRH